MKQVFPITFAAIFLLTASVIFAADTVVVVPLGSKEKGGTGWVYLNPSSASLSQGASFHIQLGAFAGIDLPDVSSPSFGLGFTIPRDFKKGSELTVRAMWNIPQSGCSVHLRPFALSIARVGRSHLTGDNAISGISVIGGSKIQAPETADQSGEVLISIQSPDEGIELEGGDSVIFGLMRWPWHSDDTCDGASMKIHGLSVSYPKE